MSLKIKTTVKTSTIPNSGNGLFADEFVPAGKIIWQLDDSDKIITITDWWLLSDDDKKYWNTYAYRVNDKLILCTDNGKYINHSNKPNTIDTIDINYGSITVAKYDINIGDEIMSDYTTFDDDSKSVKKLY